MTADEYEKQAAANPSLPKFQSDPEKYKDLIQENLKACEKEIGDNPRHERGPEVPKPEEQKP